MRARVCVCVCVGGGGGDYRKTSMCLRIIFVHSFVSVHRERFQENRNFVKHVSVTLLLFLLYAPNIKSKYKWSACCFCCCCEYGLA